MSRTRLALSTAVLATVLVCVSCAKTVDTSSGSTRTINTVDPVEVDEPGVVPPKVVNMARPAYTRAARRSTFTAGTKDGRPVPVRVTLTYDFWLRR